jgi:hypothetical protein
MPAELYVPRGIVRGKWLALRATFCGSRTWSGRGVCPSGTVSCIARRSGRTPRKIWNSDATLRRRRNRSPGRYPNPRNQLWRSEDLPFPRSSASHPADPRPFLPSRREFAKSPGHNSWSCSKQCFFFNSSSSRQYTVATQEKRSHPREGA